jgi:RNA polymerase sigma-70 factor (ECF subfamily)
MYLHEKECIENIKDGDEKALEYLVDVYYNLVFYVVKNILGPQSLMQDIEECINDIFFFLWENINKYDPNRGTIKTWIIMCSRYKTLDYRKKQNKKINIVGLEEISKILSEDNTEEYILTKETSDYILKIIDGFNQIDKQIFYFRYFLHMNINEIANNLNLSREAIDNKLWRCRKKIKQNLKSY